jgi:hypothetical protein
VVDGRDLEAHGPEHLIVVAERVPCLPIIGEQVAAVHQRGSVHMVQIVAVPEDRNCGKCFAHLGQYQMRICSFFEATTVLMMSLRM